MTMGGDMTDKWTPGPWVAIRSVPESGCDGWWIKAQPHAALRGFTHDLAWVNGGEENEANALICAAAPDMAEALDQSCKRMEALPLKASFTDDVIALCRAALAKARGQA